MEQTAYGIRVKVPLGYEMALQKTREALKEQGFGVLTEIDMKEKMKEKLGVDFKRYIILGACNPPLAWKALQAETEVGLLLPCNVIVYEEGEGSVVAALDPQALIGMAGNPGLQEMAAEARALLEKALQAVA
ncbi:MAG: DUF302 domain-containing protein [Thermoanaerobaculia bacterium]